ncbi:MAG: YtxH domain-containing protein [Bacteroidales bacterium]|nr:YtxH domain-containing protein [Bacteroidales bacterium]
MKNLSLLMAFAGGAIAGAVIGILLAPDKGVNTRKKIKDLAEESTEDAKEKIKDILESLGVNLNCEKVDSLVDELIEKETPAKQ